MSSNGSSHSSVPPEFEEAGIKPLAYGQPELAKAISYKALSRQIERNGVQDEAGNHLAEPDGDTAEALARQFVYPKGTAAAAFQAPIYKHLQAGTVALVHGPVLLTRVNPSPLNPRVGPMIAIPKPDEAGRVSVSWAPADVEVDPEVDERLRQRADSVDSLVAASRETAGKVLGLQQKLSEVIGREGIEEPLLIVQARLEIEGPGELARHLVPVAADGGSRITIAQEHLADAIGLLLSEKEKEYATKHKRRASLESLERALRAHQPASLVDDTVAERELRDFLVELSARPAAELVKNKMYAAQRSLVAPAMVVVGFRPNGDASILDAIDQLVANQHKRGPLQWQPAAQALDSRNSVVRGLWRQVEIGEGKALLLGPRYEEAYRRFDICSNPDFRIGEVVRVFHSQEARRLIREAIGTGAVQPSDRAEIITAVIGEQLRDADPEFRRQVETTLRDMTGHLPFYGGPDLPMRDSDPDELVAKVKQNEQDNPGVLSEDHVELGVKGGVALVMLGAISREHGTRTYEFPRPYALLQDTLGSEFGQELLGEAIKALREGKAYLPALDPETREPTGRDGENREIPMGVDNLRQLVSAAEEDEEEEEPTRTADDILAEIRSLARNDLGGRIEELKQHPDVVRGGLPRQSVKDASELLLNQAWELEYLGRRSAEQLKPSNGEPVEEGAQ
jgi:hypothetical protein